MESDTGSEKLFPRNSKADNRNFTREIAQTSKQTQNSKGKQKFGHGGGEGLGKGGREALRT